MDFGSGLWYNIGKGGAAMGKYENVFFDLDGTVTDSGDGIINSVIYTLKHYGQSVPQRQSLYRFIGPPLEYSFAEYCGFDRERAHEAVSVYREYYSERGIFENAVYDGVPEMLAALKSEGYGIALATSKPEKFAVRIIEHFSLSKYFDCICGADMDEHRAEKSEVLAYALEKTGADPARSVMIGDRKYDVTGAALFSIDCLGVTYGFGTREELTSAGAKYIADSPLDIKKLLVPKTLVFSDAV